MKHFENKEGAVIIIGPGSIGKAIASKLEHTKVVIVENVDEVNEIVKPNLKTLNPIFELGTIDSMTSFVDKNHRGKHRTYKKKFR